MLRLEAETGDKMCILDIISNVLTGLFVVGVIGSGIATLAGVVYLVTYLMRIDICYGMPAIPIILFLLWYAGRKGS